VLKDAEDDSFDDNEVNDALARVTFGERHKRRDECEDIEYEEQMQEAMQGSLEDCSRPHGTTQYGSSSGRGSHYYLGTLRYGGSSQGGSQLYLGSYGHHGGFDYGTSNKKGSQNTCAIPPPTFGGPYYGNYGQGGVPSGYGYNNGRGAYGGLASTYPSQKDDSSSDSE